MREVFLSQYGRVGRSEVVAEFGPLRGPRRRDSGDGVPADGSPGLDAIDATPRRRRAPFPSLRGRQRVYVSLRASGPRNASKRLKVEEATTPELV